MPNNFRNNPGALEEQANHVHVDNPGRGNAMTDDSPNLGGPLPSPLRSRGEYLRELKPHVPPHMFRRRPDVLWALAANSVVIWGSAFLIGNGAGTLLTIACMLTTSVSFTSLVMQAHDLSHETIVGRGPVLATLEIYAWGLAMVPRTLWKKLHNGLHHARVASPGDPDRRFLVSEATLFRRRYSQLFHPSRHTPRWNPLIYLGAAYFAYAGAHIAYALLGRWIGRPSILAAVPRYTMNDRRALVVELAVALGLHGALFALAGGTIAGYALAVVAPAMSSTAVFMHYIYTQHSLLPMTPIDDPLANSTSIRLPRIVDAIHHHLSHHIEHHLFPRVPSIYYPEIRRILAQRYPATFRTVPVRQALAALWRSELFAADPVPARDCD